jgi:hypothetical protein
MFWLEAPSSSSAIEPKAPHHALTIFSTNDIIAKTG